MNPKEIKKIIEDKVIGKWLACHDENGHHYKHLETGKIVDSVTQKISIEKPHLRKWYARMALEYMEPRWKDLTPENRDKEYDVAVLAGSDSRDDAGRVGTSGHGYIDDYLQSWIKTGVKPADIKEFIKPDIFGFIDSRVIAAARSAEKLFNKYNVVPIASELLVGDEKIGVAGTMDFLALFDGKLMVSDWKTSNRVSDEYAMQVSAYMYLFQRMTGIKVDGCNLVQLSKKNDSFRVYDIPRPNEAFAAFKGQVKTYDWIYNKRQKLTEDKKIIEL